MSEITKWETYYVDWQSLTTYPHAPDQQVGHYHQDFAVLTASPERIPESLRQREARIKGVRVENVEIQVFGISLAVNEV